MTKTLRTDLPPTMHGQPFHPVIGELQRIEGTTVEISGKTDHTVVKISGLSSESEAQVRRLLAEHGLSATKVTPFPLPGDESPIRVRRMS